MISDLKIRLFGDFEVMVGGHAVRVRTHKDLELLSYLAFHHDTVVDRDQIADVFWTKDKQGKPIDYNAKSALLSRTLHELWKALDPEKQRLTKPTSKTLMFRSEGVEIDLMEFETALTVADPAALDRAARIYHSGALLADGKGEWIEAARKEITSRYLKTLWQAARKSRDQNDLVSASIYLDRVLEIEPFYETALRLQMELLIAERKVSQFRARYDEYERLLKAQGRSASPETQDCFSRLQGEAAKFTHLGHIPCPTSKYIAREEDLRTILPLLHTHRLILLTGMGGMGKSRLAIEVAQSIQEEFYDRVWFVEMVDVQQPEKVTQQVAALFRVREQPGRALEETLIDFLRAKRLLLVLDNCEHLLDACAHLTERLLRHCPDLKVMVTSREPFDITGEAVWRVPTLDYPDAVNGRTPEALKDFSAIELFLERASSVQVPFRVDESNSDAVVQICRQLEGIPLALELAAARVGRAFDTIHAVAESLKYSLQTLSLGSRTAPPHQRTLWATIEWSYRSLKREEQAVLRRLSVFRGGWTLEEAKYVCVLTEETPGDFEEAFLSLINKSLVERIETPKKESHLEVRYRLLEMVRQYAWEQLQGEKEPVWASLFRDPLSEVRDRHLKCFLRLALEVENNSSWPRLDAEHANIQAALGWAWEQRAGEVGLKMASALWRFWHDCGYHQEGLDWLNSFLKCGQDTSLTERLKALTGAGNLAVIRAEYTLARELFEESLQLKRGIGKPRGIAIGLASLANVAVGEEDYQQAHTLYTESLKLFRELPDMRAVALTLTNLGVVAYGQEDYEAACKLHEQSLALFREQGDQNNITMVTNNLADTLVVLGDYDKALPLFLECLELCQELKQRPRFAYCLANLVSLAVKQGQTERAGILLGAAEALRHRLRLLLSPASTRSYEQDRDKVYHLLELENYGSAYDYGRSLTEEQIMNYLRDA